MRRADNSPNKNENDSRIVGGVLSLASRRVAASALSLIAAATLLSACGDDATDSAGRPIVAATAPQVDVLARELAGDGITVAEVVPATADVHDLELRPSQVRAIKDADLVLRPGRDNDAWASEALDSAGGKQLDVAADVAGDERHWWMDPEAALAAAAVITQRFDELDPAGTSARAERLATLRDELTAVDAATKRCLAAVPAERRRIVTDHDAIGAYAQRYGLEVVGTIAPGSEPEASPSAQRLVELERTMREQKVTAVFPIAPHGSKLVDQVAERGGAVAGEALWADALPGATHEDHDHEVVAHGDEDEHAGEEHAEDEHAEGDHAEEGHAEGEHAEKEHAEEEHAESTTPHEHDLLTEAALRNGLAVAKALRAPSAACSGLGA